MSELVLDWLNNEVGLSKRLYGVTKEFSNGYLFAELFYKYKKIPDLEDFKNTTLENDILANFKALAPLFKPLGIDLPMNIMKDIMHQQNNTALKILLQTKMALEKETLFPPINGGDKSKIANSFSKTTKDPLKKRLENKLQRFDLEWVTNVEKTVRQEQIVEATKLQARDERRREELEKRQKNREYLESFTTKGWEDWQKNQDQKKNRLIAETEFRSKMTGKLRENFEKFEEYERNDVIQGFIDFETNARRLGVDLEHDFEPTKKVEKAPFQTSVFMAKLKAETAHAEEARREREKWKRKVKLDQEKAQAEIEVKKKEENLVKKFVELSTKQNEELDKVWKKKLYKRLAYENRVAYGEELRKKKEEEIEAWKAGEEERSKGLAEERDREHAEKKKIQREINLENKIRRRKKHYELCSGLFDIIFEMSEICFKHQVENDSIQIDPRFWKSLTDAFIEDQIKVPKKIIRRVEPQQDQLSSGELRAREDLLRSTEILDYIHGLNIWKPIHIGVEQLIEGDDTAITSRPLNNDILGDVIEALIDMKYPRKQPPQKPQLPDYLPIKIVLLGNPFSGRKTVAKFLKSRYGVEIFNMTEIIKEAIELNNPIPEEDPKKASKKATKKGQPEEVKEVNLELKQVGVEIKALKEQGQPIPTELYIRAFLAKLCKAFPNKTQDEVYDEVRQIKAAEEAKIAEFIKQEEKNNAKASKKPSKKDTKAPVDQVPVEDPIQTRINERRCYYTKGWVLLDFPNDPLQMKLLERALTGYVPENELLNETAETAKDEAQIIVKPSNKPAPKKELRPSGIDLALVLDVPVQEMVRRAANRKIDPETGEIYHPEDRPPPTDNKIVNRLQLINDPEATEPALKEKAKNFETQKPQYEEWFKDFGFEEIGLPTLHVINSFAKPDQVQEAVDKNIKELLEYKQKKLNKVVGELMGTSSSVELKRTEESKKTEEFKNPDVLKVSDKKLVPTSMKSVNERKYTEELQAVQAGSRLELNGTPLPDSVKDEAQRSSANLEPIPIQTLSPEALKIIYTLWQRTFLTYVEQTKESLINLRDQRMYVSSRIIEMQKEFLDVLLAADDKSVKHNNINERRLIEFFFFLSQELLFKFYDSYNKFFADNTELMEEKQTKEEIMKRLEKLNENLWEIVEQKKNDSIAKRKSIIESAYFEKEMTFLIDNVVKLMQGELDRYFAFTTLLYDYYYTPDVSKMVDSPEELVEPILLDPKTLPPIEDPNQPGVCLQIAKFYDNALKVMDNRRLETPPVLSKIIKSMSPGKRKKDTKAFTIHKLFELEDIGPRGEEFRRAFFAERAATRYRLYVLKVAAESRVRELRLQANALYNKLDDWIIYGIKYENDAVYEKIKEFRAAIEAKTRIEDEFEFTYPEIHNQHRFLNYQSPPPFLLPPLEKPGSDRFTISSLYSFAEELRCLAFDGERIDSTILLQFLTRRIGSKLSQKEFPRFLQSFNPKNFSITFRRLDPNNTGVVPLKPLVAYFCLLSSAIPDEAELAAYRESLEQVSKDGGLNKEDFASTPAWFDNNESSEPSDEESIRFDRADLLKQLLFHFLKEKRGEIVKVEKLLQILSCEIFTTFDRLKFKTYASFLFETI